MKIERLTITNFMPYKGRQEIDFPQHETQNMMLIFGDNMRGKTSFLNAIRWGFYGVALGRHLRKIPRVNLINSDAAKEGEWSTSVSILFEHDNKKYELIRKIEKHSNTNNPHNDADFKESIGLRINGDPITGDKIKSEINQVMPQEVSRFFLFDGELLQEYENLLIEENEQGKKIKEHIESILGVPALINSRNDLQTLLKDARSEQRKEAQKIDELRGYAQDQKSHEVRYESLEENLKDLNVQREDLQGKIDEIEEFLKNTEALLSKKIDLTRLEVDEKNIEEKISKLNTDIHGLLKTAWKDVLTSYLKPISNKFKHERNNMQSKLEDSIKLKSRIDDLRKSIEEHKICNTCGQNIPDEMLNPIRAEIDRLVAGSSSIDLDIGSLSMLSRKIDNLESIQSEGEVKRIVEAINEVTKNKVYLTSIENKKDDLVREIKGRDTDHIMRKREEKDRWEKQVIRIQIDIDNALNEMNKNRQKQDMISKLIAKHQGNKSSKSSLRVERLQQLEKVFSEGISQLREKLKSDVERYATETFKQLTTEKTYAGLQINQSYGLSILDPEGRVLNERSAGAEQVVALSLIDGLNKTSGTKAPIVMDTPLGRLDPKHRENILKYLPDMSEQVVLLVHEGEINSKRDTHIFASRIGARYEIKRISATQSYIEKVI